MVLSSTHYRHISLGEVDSTNNEAIKLAMAGDAGNIWITANSQTLGKARRGRQWISKAGNLYASLLLIDFTPQTNASVLPLLAAVALYDSMAKIINNKNNLKIKWPNDLLLNNKKIAGILLEQGKDCHGRQWTVLGFGVNCLHYPQNVLHKATSFTNEGYAVLPSEIFQSLFDCTAEALANWQKYPLPENLSSQWLERCCGLGSQIEVRLANETLSGIFENLDKSGNLILQTKDETRYIAAGDVFLSQENEKHE